MPATISILTAVMGAVGPDICVLVPPNKAAKNAINMAPYRPASGPRPELNPKANAKGSATIPAVSPPNKSPLIVENMPAFFCSAICYISRLKCLKVEDKMNY